MNKDIIKNNIIIWKALNKIDPNRYPSPVNGGRGLSLENSYISEPFRTSVFEPGDVHNYKYFHNDWSYLMEALLLIKKERLIRSFDDALTDLIFWSNELTKDLPETFWCIENDKSEWITKDYNFKYNIVTAEEHDIIPTTKNVNLALSFELQLEADEYLSKNFQARHVYAGSFKATEHKYI